MRSRGFVLFQLGLAMIVPFLVFFWINGQAYNTTMLISNSFLYFIGFIAVLAIVISIIMGIVAGNLRNIKILFVSLAYASIGGMLIFHGLSLPSIGLVMEENYYTVYAQLAIMFSSMWLWLSSLSADHRLVRFLARHRKKLVPLWCIALISIGLVRWLIKPEQIDFIVFNNYNLRIVTLMILLFNTWTVYRHLITYMASRFSIQLAIVYSTGWMNTAQIVLISRDPSVLLWLMYHSLLFLSMVVMLWLIIKEFAHTESLTASIKQLYRADPDRWIQTYITPSVSELVRKTETKDAYTAGHNYRVTVYALKLGEEMGLSSTQLKSIAIGGLVHDVGKIHIPDYVLNKPGKLTEEERGLIERHPIDGYNMCKGVGFMMEELAIIRSHHEKWDGTGYPDRLSGESIPLVARVTAVADVYDALTSSRSYRKAMSREKAMSIITEDSGKHFDPRCVEAWINIVEEERSFFEQMLVRSSYMSHIYRVSKPSK